MSGHEEFFGLIRSCISCRLFAASHSFLSFARPCTCTSLVLVVQFVLYTFCHSGFIHIAGHFSLLNSLLDNMHKSYIGGLLHAKPLVFLPYICLVTSVTFKHDTYSVVQTYQTVELYARNAGECWSSQVCSKHCYLPSIIRVIIMDASVS